MEREIKDFLDRHFGQSLSLSWGGSGNALGGKIGASVGTDLTTGPFVSGSVGDTDPDAARAINWAADVLGVDKPYTEDEIQLMEDMDGWGFTFGRASEDFTLSTTPKSTGYEPYSNYYVGAGLLGGTLSIPGNSDGFDLSLHLGPQLGIRQSTTLNGTFSFRDKANEKMKDQAPQPGAFNLSENTQDDFDVNLSLDAPFLSSNPQAPILSDIPDGAKLSVGGFNQQAVKNNTIRDPFGDLSRTSAIEQRSQAQREQEAQQNAQATAQHNRTEPQAPGKEEAPSALSPITKTETVGVLGADLLEENAVSKAQERQRFAGETVGDLQREQESRGGYPARGSGSAKAQKTVTQIALGAGASGRSTGYNDFQDLATALSNSGQHGNVGVSDLTDYGTIRGSEQTKALGKDAYFAPDAFDKTTWNNKTQKGKGGGDSGGSGSRVICTELVRQGLMSPNLQRLDIAFTLKHLSPATVRGYHFWAVPYVRLMKRSSLATRLVEPLARWRAEEIAYRMKARSRPHWRGRVVRLIGEPVCWAMGGVLGWTGDPDRFYPRGVSKPGQG